MLDKGQREMELESGLDSDSFYSIIKCPICGGDSSLTDSINTINPHSKQKFDLRECSCCFHGWIDPMPTQKYLNILYEAGSPYVVQKNTSASCDQVQSLSIPEKNVLNKELEINRGDLQGLKYLEIGTGDGNLFASFAKEIGRAHV